MNLAQLPSNRLKATASALAADLVRLRDEAGITGRDEPWLKPLRAAFNEVNDAYYLSLNRAACYTPRELLADTRRPGRHVGANPYRHR